MMKACLQFSEMVDEAFFFLEVEMRKNKKTEEENSRHFDTKDLARQRSPRSCSVHD